MELCKPQKGRVDELSQLRVAAVWLSVPLLRRHQRRFSRRGVERSDDGEVAQVQKKGALVAPPVLTQKNN